MESKVKSKVTGFSEVTAAKPSFVLCGLGLMCLMLAACNSSDDASSTRINSFQAGSLFQSTEGYRPGPDILYAEPARSPQLENVAPWVAEPILVSGTSAYRKGEFLYQDFLYDDHGASGIPDPVGNSFLTEFSFSPVSGTLTYPKAPDFASNAADLVEFRVKPLGSETAFRLTLNTLIDASRSAFTIAIGQSDSPRVWPHSAGVQSPAALFLTVNGTTASLIDAATGKEILPAPTVKLDMQRRQFDVRVAHAAWNPGREQVRMSCGVGLWDSESGSYLKPSVSASDTAPGGMAPGGSSLFNVAFRFNEPLPDFKTYGLARMYVDALALFQATPKMAWREYAQSQALRDGDLTPFFAMVDFSKLANKTEDDSGVPKSGKLNRIFASHFAPAQGLDFTKMCGRLQEGGSCEGVFRGQLQPYAIYVPDRAAPKDGWGLTLLLHALGTNYNLFTNSKYQSSLGERGKGSLVITPHARGHDGDYTDYAEADVFEVWADVARHYPLDKNWSAVTGFSMGGGGTFSMLARWPDLFGRGAGVAAVPEGDRIKSYRNTPVMTWVGMLEEGSTLDRQFVSSSNLEKAGLSFVFDQFFTADHLTLATNDEYGPLVEFLGEYKINPDPPHVTFWAQPKADSVRAKTVADHAYWLSGLKVRDSAGGKGGLIDAYSKGFGLSPAMPKGVVASTEVLQGGAHGPMLYQRSSQELEPRTPIAASDELVVEAQNIAYMMVDVRRARLSCNPVIKANSDGPLKIELKGCNRVLDSGF